MDLYGIERGMVRVTWEEDDTGAEAVRLHPERFIASYGPDPHEGVDALRKIQRAQEDFGIRAVTIFSLGLFPMVPINDKLMCPIYAKCVELGLSVWVNAGVPRPRVPFGPQ